MTKTLTILTAILSVFLVACNGGNSGNNSSNNSDANTEETADVQDDGIHPASTKVLGPLKDYFEVVDKPYKINKEVFEKINVEFKRLAGRFPLQEGESFVDSKSDKGLYIRLIIEFMDEDGNVISTEAGHFDSLKRLASFDEGDTGTVSFFVNGETPAKFRISSEMEHVEKDEKKGAGDDLDDVKAAAEAIGAMGNAIGAMGEAASKLK